MACLLGSGGSRPAVVARWRFPPQSQSGEAVFSTPSFPASASVSFLKVSLPEGCTLSELLAVLGAKKQRSEPAAGMVGLLSPLAPAAAAAAARGGAAPGAAAVPGTAVAGPAGSVASTYWSPLAGSSIAPSSSLASRRPSTEGGEQGHGQGQAAGGAGIATPSPAPPSAQPSTVQTSLLGGAAAAMAAAAGSTISGLQKVSVGEARGLNVGERRVLSVHSALPRAAFTCLCRLPTSPATPNTALCILRCRLPSEPGTHCRAPPPHVGPCAAAAAIAGVTHWLTDRLTDSHAASAASPACADVHPALPPAIGAGAAG